MIGRLIEWLFDRVDYYVVREDVEVVPRFMSDERIYRGTITLVPDRARKFHDCDEAYMTFVCDESCANLRISGVAFVLVAIHKSGRESVVPW